MKPNSPALRESSTQSVTDRAPQDPVLAYERQAYESEAFKGEMARRGIDVVAFHRQGGGGCILLGFERALSRHVAVKIYHRWSTGGEASDAAADALRREATLLGRLSN